MPSTDAAASFGSLAGTAWAVVGQPLYYLLGVFSNLMYSTFLGVYNDPSSWKTTLLPPLATLLAMYVAVRMVSSTVRSTVRMVWFAIKWSVLLFAALAAYNILAGEGEIATSPGVTPAKGWRSTLRTSGTDKFVPVHGSTGQSKDELAEHAQELLVTVGTQAIALVRTLPLDVQATLASMTLSAMRLFAHLFTPSSEPESESKRTTQPRFSTKPRTRDTRKDDPGLLGTLGLNTQQLFQSEKWQPVQEWVQEALDPERREKDKRKDNAGKRASKKSTRHSRF